MASLLMSRRQGRSGKQRLLRLREKTQGRRQADVHSFQGDRKKSLFVFKLSANCFLYWSNTFLIHRRSCQAAPDLTGEGAMECDLDKLAMQVKPKQLLAGQPLQQRPQQQVPNASL